MNIFRHFPPVMEACGADPGRIPPAVFDLLASFLEMERRRK